MISSVLVNSQLRELISNLSSLSEIIQDTLKIFIKSISNSAGFSINNLHYVTFPSVICIVPWQLLVVSSRYKPGRQSHTLVSGLHNSVNESHSPPQDACAT